MNKIIEQVKTIFTKEAWEGSLDRMMRLENDRINTLKDKAVKHLNKQGWTILSTNTTIAFYGYRIQKGNQIYTVSIDEALKIKP